MTVHVLSSGFKLVVFDWGGTAVDHGCFGPVVPFVETFRACGIEVTPEEARGPMGLQKREHLRALARLPSVAARWQEVHGRPCTDADADEVYERLFVPRQLAVLPSHSRLVSGLLDCVGWLRFHGVLIGTTTGYFAEAARLVVESARQQGFEADCNVCEADVPAGRPAPWMLYRIMGALDVYPPASVVKVGDTVPDVQEGRNAGAWSVGVARTGSEVGLSDEQWAALPVTQQRERLAGARQKLLAAGAHAVIDSVADLPHVLPVLQARLDQGERP